MAKNKELIRSLKFVLFSASAGIIQVVSFTLMEEVLHWTHWVSYLVALILSVLWNFTLNRKFTFHSAGNVPVAMLKVFGFYLVFTPLSTWLGQLAENQGINEYIILFTTMLANFILEFLFCKFVVFRGQENTRQTKA